MNKLTFYWTLSGVLIIFLTIKLNAQITINLKAFLEGPFNSSSMNTVLNNQNLISLSQPYNDSPWNYPGIEQVSSIPNADIVDWVLVELRETSGDASTATPDKMINRQAAFIKSDGSTVGTDGSSLIIYSGTITLNLYVIIWHRNHLAIMSSGPLNESGGIFSWDFTDQLSKVYLDGQKQIGAGVFGMIAGDCDGNGRIYTRDKRLEWYSEGGYNGYYQSDLNLDSQVDNKDKDDCWEPNFGLTTKIPTDLSWECFMEFTDTRDGQVYSTVETGTQCWMAENLNIGTMIQGATEMADNSIIEKYCYDNTTANCDVYGGLYQWNEMMQYVSIPGLQGICPADWHIPTDAEWTVLTDLLGGESVAGGKMKEAGTTHWNSPNTGATNESGFTGLPGGLRTVGGTLFNQMGSYANIWSSTGGVTGNAWRRSLGYSTNSVSRYAVYEFYGLSVRCVRD